MTDMDSQPIRLDIHAHLIPLADAGGAAVSGVGQTAEGLWTVDGSALPAREAYDPARLVHWMDLHAVEQAWVSVPPTLYRPALESEAARNWAMAINAGLRAAASRFASRLAPLLHLPLRHPAVAEAIVRDAAARGFRRFAMAAGDAGSGLSLSDPGYDRLWSALDAAEAFLFLHPRRGCDGRLDRFHLHNLLGGPGETALAAAHLIFGGVLDRFPGIAFGLAHGGGATAAVAGRLARGQATGRAGDHVPAPRPRLRRFCVDCITHDPQALGLVASVHGADRIVFGSDWPFAMGLPDPAGQLADVDPALRRAILRDNAASLLARGEKQR